MLLAKNKQLLHEHLQYSFSGGVALTLVTLLAYLCINLTGKIASIFFSAAMLDFSVTKDSSLGMIVGTALSLVLSIVLLSPLRLNIKGWYQHTNDGDLPVTMAFSYFTSMKKYLKAVNYCVIRFILLFVTYLVPLAPSFILMAVMRYAFGRADFVFNSYFSVLLIATISLFVLGIVFAIYFSIDYFFADFIYIKKIEQNPFKVLFMSRKIAKKNKGSLYLTIATTLPYYLLCIFIVTIPFVLPKIRVIHAVYADEILY